MPEGEHLVPFGVARIARDGDGHHHRQRRPDRHRALEAAEILAAEGIACEVIDLRTIMPLDVETVAASVGKTHRLLVVDEAYAMCGVGAEIAQAMNELASTSSTRRSPGCTPRPSSHPFAPALERAMLVSTDAHRRSCEAT